MIRHAVTAALLLAALSGAAQAQFRADNWHEVYLLPSGNFEVIQRPGSGPSQFWCAAGDFARHALGAAANRPVYLARGRGPSLTQPGQRSVIFSLQPPQAALDRRSAPLTLDLDAIGDSLRAAFAYQYCLDDIVREFP